MRAAITSTIGAVLLAASMSANNGPIVPIAGGTFEASGAVALDGGVLFVDDSRPDRLFWMAIDDEGRQKGTAEAIPLGVSVTVGQTALTVMP